MMPNNPDDFDPTIIENVGSAVSLIVREGPQQGERFLLNRSNIVVGRAPECDISLKDSEVSRRNSRFFWQSGRLYLQDLGSANGTLVNGQPITQQEINPGDRIEIGGSLLQVQGLPSLAAAQGGAPVAAPAASQSQDSLWLILGVLIGVIMLALLFVVAAFWYFSAAQDSSPPSVAFVTPGNGAEFSTQNPITVQASGSDDRGVVRMELWVDGALIDQVVSNNPQGEQVMQLNMLWTPSGPGNHVIEVRAFDADNQRNETTLVAVNINPVMTPTAVVVAATVTPQPDLTATPFPTASATSSSQSDTIAQPTNTATATPTPQPALRVVAEVNVRGGPGTTYNTLGGLKVGDNVRALGRSADGNWWQVVYPPNTGATGWVSGLFVEPNEQALVVPIAAAPPVPATAAPANVVIGWQLRPQLAQYGGSSYANELARVPNGSEAICKAACAADNACTYFFFNARGNLDFGGDNAPKSSKYLDCVLFTNTPGLTSAPQSDAYIKTYNGVDAWEYNRSQLPSPPTAPPLPAATPTVTPTPTTSPDIAFFADRTNLNAGECTVLRWRVRNVKAYWVDGSDGVGDEGLRNICDPVGTTVHLLRVQKMDDSFQEFTLAITVQ